MYVINSIHNYQQISSIYQNIYASRVPFFYTDLRYIFQSSCGKLENKRNYVLVTRWWVEDIVDMQLQFNLYVLDSIFFLMRLLFVLISMIPTRRRQRQQQHAYFDMVLAPFFRKNVCMSLSHIIFFSRLFSKILMHYLLFCFS